MRRTIDAHYPDYLETSENGDLLYRWQNDETLHNVNRDKNFLKTICQRAKQLATEMKKIVQFGFKGNERVTYYVSPDEDITPEQIIERQLKDSQNAQKLDESSVFTAVHQFKAKLKAAREAQIKNLETFDTNLLILDIEKKLRETQATDIESILELCQLMYEENSRTFTLAFLEALLQKGLFMPGKIVSLADKKDALSHAQYIIYKIVEFPRNPDTFQEVHLWKMKYGKIAQLRTQIEQS